MSDRILDTSKVWLDVKTVAELKGITERAVRLSLKQQNKYKFETEDIRGGKWYQHYQSTKEYKEIYGDD